MLFSFLEIHAQFFLNGDAVAISDTCFQLTQDVNNSSGSIWNPDKIDLSESFEVVMQIYLGCKDASGADGIVFGFQPVSTSLGSAGGGLGFENIIPSLGIEFDTYQNINSGDPVFDHLAIISNGSVNHNNATNLEGPVQASPDSPNIEDCEWHDLRVSWSAPNRRLEVYFDCSLRLSYTGDIVNTIFGGDPLVFWGFTSATGALNNIQQICFEFTTFLDELEDVVVCPGGQVGLSAKGGITYTWTPTAGLSNPNGQFTFAAPEETTLYTVEVRDVCNNPFYDDVLVEVAGDSVFFDLGPDTTICEGQSLLLDVTTPTAIYKWSTGATSPSISLTDRGVYGVTVTRTDTFCISSDLLELGIIDLPEVELGPDTSLCQGESVKLGATFPNANYEWNDGSFSDSLLVRASGAYQVAVSNECGLATDVIQVLVERCDQVYLPQCLFTEW